MKSKEIIATLDIQNGLRGKEKQDKFLALMLEELRESYKNFGQKDSERHFNAAVKDLHQKWNGISIKIKSGLSDGLWRFFFASQVIKLKEELCPTWAERQRREHDSYLERQAKREEKQRELREKYAIAY